MSLFCKSSTEFKRIGRLQQLGKKQPSLPLQWAKWQFAGHVQISVSIKPPIDVSFLPWIAIILTITTPLTSPGNGQGVKGALRAKRDEHGILREARETRDDSSPLVWRLALVSRFTQNAPFASLRSQNAYYAGLPRANSCSLSPQDKRLWWELKVYRISWSSRELGQRCFYFVFEQYTSTGRRLLTFFGSFYAQIFRQIVSMRTWRVKTLSKTQLVASKHIKREKDSLPVDVRRLKRLLHKLSLVMSSFQPF